MDIVREENRPKLGNPVSTALIVALATLLWVGADGDEPSTGLYAASAGDTPAASGAADGTSFGGLLQNPFVGSWNGTDPIDGSGIHVTIASDSLDAGHTVIWREDAIQRCGGERGSIEAEGETDGENTLRLSGLTLTCLKTQETELLPDNFGFIYSPDTDTIAFWFFEDDEPVFAVIGCFHRSGHPKSCA